MQKKCFIKGLYQSCGIALGLIGLIVVFFVILKFLGKLNPLNLLTHTYILTGKKQPSPSTTLKELLEQNTIISTNEVFSHILSYYDVLVTFLVAILGVVGVIAFFYIKGSSEERAENTAKKYSKKFTDDYFNTLDFDKKIQKKMEDVTRDYTESTEEIPKKFDKLDEFTKSVDERLKSLEDPKKEINNQNT